MDNPSKPVIKTVLKKPVDKNQDNHPALKKKIKLQNKAADLVTKWVGSWTFIILLFVFMFIWIGINVYLVTVSKWDPYPFILLNFVLSTLAAIQAPIILMSQNRKAELDRTTAKYDYQIDRKSEREIQKMTQGLDEIKRMLKSMKK
ncbi:MAG: DUF1003 domain-containing protein [Candidatus Aenigmatarchaeota archaeon]